MLRVAYVCCSFVATVWCQRLLYRLPVVVSCASTCAVVATLWSLLRRGPAGDTKRRDTHAPHVSAPTAKTAHETAGSTPPDAAHQARLLVTLRQVRTVGNDSNATQGSRFAARPKADGASRLSNATLPQSPSSSDQHWRRRRRGTPSTSSGAKQSSSSPRALSSSGSCSDMEVLLQQKQKQKQQQQGDRQQLRVDEDAEQLVA